MQKKTVLVIDDSKSALKLVSPVLSDGGFEVRTQEGASGCSIIAHEAKPDIVLLDLHMPVPRNIAIKFVRAAAPNAKVYLFSNDPEAEKIAKICNADGVVTKRDIRGLAITVRKLVK